MKKTAILLLALVMLISFCACDNSGAQSEAESSAEASTDPIFSIEGNETTLNYDTKNPVAAISIKNYGTVVVELYPDVAPNTVNNFISLIKKGFYDNNTMHRCVSGFVLQGGDPTGTGRGGPGYSIKGEFSGNGFFKNKIAHDRGVLSMARSMHPNSAGSQFFIMVADAPHLDGQYAAFGKITDNAQAAVDISRVNRDMFTDKPKKPQTIKSIRVDTQGVEYPVPEKH